MAGGTFTTRTRGYYRNRRPARPHLLVWCQRFCAWPETRRFVRSTLCSMPGSFPGPLCRNPRTVAVAAPSLRYSNRLDFINAAADDPQVLAIKQTLYRVSGDSPTWRVIRAAQAGKQVTVLLELKARFDEENNIQWARQLERAGAHVMYGVMGYKVHAKLLLVVRRDDDGIRRYAHLGTELQRQNRKTLRRFQLPHCQRGDYPRRWQPLTCSLASRGRRIGSASL